MRRHQGRGQSILAEFITRSMAIHYTASGTNNVQCLEKSIGSGVRRIAESSPILCNPRENRMIPNIFEGIPSPWEPYIHQQKGELYTLDCGDDKPTKIF